MPATVKIVLAPTGAIVATGGDDLAHRLLKHAGFTQHSDWNGIRHRLDSRTDEADGARIVSDAAGMLGAAHYRVEVSRELAGEVFPLNAQLLALADAVRGAETGQALAQVLTHLVDIERGVLVRLQEAVEAAAEQVGSLDPDAIELSDRLSGASDGLFEIAGEMQYAAYAARALAPGDEGFEAAVRPGSPAAGRAGARPSAQSAEAPSPAASKVRIRKGR